MIRLIRAAGLFGLSLAAALAAPGRVDAQRFRAAGESSSQGNIEGFTVSGKGLVTAKPNRLEIDLEVTAASELTADAIVKYRDAKKRLEDAFAALKLPNVAVEERGLLVDQKGSSFNPYYFDSMPNKRNKVEVQLSRKLIVTCSKIQDMDEEAVLQLAAKLLDVAQDSGGKIGQQVNMMYYYYFGGTPPTTPSLVRFVIDDFDKLQDDAYAKAVDDARSRAARLAKLSRVELGPVAGIREVAVSGDLADGGASEEMPKKQIVSGKYQEIPIRVELLVRFDPSGPAKAPAQGGGQ